MTDLNIISDRWLHKEQTFIIRAKNSKNQIVEAQFIRVGSFDNYTWWNMMLMVKKKKQTYEDVEGQQTGNQTGVENLLIGKEIIKHFIETHLKNNFADNRLIIFGADQRRFEIYKRGLKDLGFIEDNVENRPVLSLFIEKK